MPLNCPKKYLETARCLICPDNKEGYCRALCPPKECKRLIKDILTTDERISILESQIVNIRYLEDVEEIESRLVSLESRIEESFRLLEKMGNILEKASTLQETVNLTLSKFSKRLLELEEFKKSSYSKEIF